MCEQSPLPSILVQKSIKIKGDLCRLQVSPAALGTVVVSGVLSSSLLGGLRLLPDLGTGSGKLGFLGVEWVVSETKPLRPS